VVPRPSYVATALVAEHLRRDTVRLEAAAMLHGTYVEGELELEYPLVTAVAFVDDTSATIVGLHRDLAAARRVTFDLPEGWSRASARAYAPDHIDTPIGDAPVEIVALDVEQGGRRLSVEIPPHALFAITLVAD
jgi:hypothetical protein